MPKKQLTNYLHFKNRSLPARVISCFSSHNEVNLKVRFQTGPEVPPSLLQTPRLVFTVVQGVKVSDTRVICLPVEF